MGRTRFSARIGGELKDLHYNPKKSEFRKLENLGISIQVAATYIKYMENLGYFIFILAILDVLFTN